MFCISSETLELKLEVLEVAALFPHEEIIEPSAARLIVEFKNLVSLQNPIIVDDNNVVLDGNHRLYAFRSLGFRFIPVCRINYFNENVKLRCWFRLLGNIRKMDFLFNIVEEYGGGLQSVTGKRALKENLQKNCFVFGVQRKNECALACLPNAKADDAVRAYQVIQEIQDRLVSLGATIAYIPCNSMEDDHFCATLKKDQAVLWTPRVAKQTVIDAAKKKTLFAPKTTRHLIPARPLNVNVPAYRFREHQFLDEINHWFEQFLKTKKIRKFAPGQVIDGRYYEEALYVFYQ